MSLEKEVEAAVAAVLVGENILQDHSKTADNSAKECAGSTLVVIHGTKSVRGPIFVLHGPYLPLPTPQPIASSICYVDSETRSSPVSLSSEDWQQGQRVRNCLSTVSCQMQTLVGILESGRKRFVFSSFAYRGLRQGLSFHPCQSHRFRQHLGRNHWHLVAEGKARGAGEGNVERAMISMERGVLGHAAGSVVVVSLQQNLLRWLLSLL